MAEGWARPESVVLKDMAPALGAGGGSEGQLTADERIE